MTTTFSIRTSPEIDQIAAALALAQGEFKPVIKSRKNPHFKSDYADLASILEATRPSLSKYGIAFIQIPFMHESRVFTLTRLIHKSGQWMEGDLGLKPAADTPQGCGSTITYCKRYSAAAMLGVDGEADDDGEAGSNPDKDAAIKRLNETIQSLQKELDTLRANIPKPPVMFNSNDLKHLEGLERKLKELKITDDHHVKIAAKYNGRPFTKDALDAVIKEIFENVTAVYLPAGAMNESQGV